MSKEQSTLDADFENNSKQDKIDHLYLKMAFIWAENSYAIRRQVGCLIVKNNSIISDGYNGTPSGFPNVCEYAVAPDEGQSYYMGNRNEILEKAKEGWSLVSYPMVLHAESNAIAKLAKSGNSSKDATIYITDEPCIDCAKLIIQVGIKRVVFAREYRKHEGIELLNRANIIVKQINIQENGN